MKLNRENYYYDDEKKKGDDKDMKIVIVEKDRTIRGFNYGRQLVCSFYFFLEFNYNTPKNDKVPVDETLLEGLKKYRAEKCMKLRGFTDAKNVPRHHFLTGVDMIIPIQGIFLWLDFLST